MAEGTGLGIPNFLTGLTVFLIILFGPSDPVWRFPAYLLIPPALAWFVLRWIWRVWRPNPATEDRIRRVIAGGIAAGAVVGAVLALNAKEHYECTQEARTADGTECVGDYVRVSGPDRGGAFIYGLAAFLAMRFAVKSDPT